MFEVKVSADYKFVEAANASFGNVSCFEMF